MGKLVVLTFAEGDFDKAGFPVTLQLGDEGKPATIQEIGSLPPNPELVESYTSWKVTYYGFIGVKVRKLEAKVAQTTNFSIRDVNTKAENLSQKFNQWLKSPQFSHVREELVAHLKENDEVRLIIQTSNIQLRQLPWHLWDILKRYPKAEISVSAPIFRQVTSAKVANNKVKILAIFGDDEGINVEEDRKILNSIPGAKVEFLVKPHRQALNDQLWEQSWDILFFAGHSCTEGETGIIHINKTESLTIPDLRYALKKAIGKGLQLAIFNSCDGLGLAQNLADLNLPQMIVMREPVPDKVAQEFLKYFLGYFSRGQSFYLAVKEARERLQGWEGHFPCASWLPVICQNVAKLPPTWIELQATQHYSDRDSSLLQPKNDNDYKPPVILSKNNILSGLTQWLQKKYTRIADNQSITKLPEYCPCCRVSINYTNYAHKYVINWDEDKREFRVELFLICVYDGYELHHDLLKRLPLSIAQDSFCSCGSKLSLSNHTIRRSGDEFEFEGIYICLVCSKEQRRIFNDLKRRIYNSWKNINSIEI